MSIIFLTGLILSAAIGLSLGLIGGGGSILTVPILIYFLGVETHEAVTMSLAVVGATSLFGSFLHFRRDNLDFQAALIFGISGIFGAFSGSPLTHLVKPEILLLLFAGLMFVVAVSMIWRRKTTVIDEQYETNLTKSILAGFGVGFLTGFLGVGGGFLIVPALIFFGGLPMKKAVGTSLFVIFLNCVAGLIGHAAQSHFDWYLTILVIILAVGGTIFGTILSHRLAAPRLQKVFAMLIFGVALFIFVKNYSVLF